MKRYYAPSNDEKTILNNITNEVEVCFKKNFGANSPKVIYSYENGEEFERAGQNHMLIAKVVDNCKQGKEYDTVYIFLFNFHLCEVTLTRYSGKAYRIYTPSQLNEMKREKPVRKGNWAKVRNKKENDTKSPQPKPIENKPQTQPEERRKTEYEEYEEEMERRAREFEESFRGNYKGPARISQPAQTEEDDFDLVEDYMYRKAYCEQYEHDFGTKSTFVSDMPF